MKKILFPFFIMLIITIQACDNSVILPRPSGSPYEVLVVMDEKPWKSEGGKNLFDLLSANTPGIPQAENTFSISRVNSANFTDMIRIARNVIVANISDIYSKPKITFRKDVWASPQVVIEIVAPDAESFIKAVEQNSDAIVQYIVDAELKRQADYYRKNYNANITNKIKELYGIEMYVPAIMKDENIKDNFFWTSNRNMEIRQDIIIYTYPYTDPNTFTEEFLLAKRDSVLKYNLPGPKEGSYMATEIEHFPPLFKEVWKNGKYCAEIRGWWRVEGDKMGGPFISHTQYDEVTKQIITIEAFVFAPGHNKRTSIRQLEAVLYAAKLPQDLVNNTDTQTQTKK